MWLRIFLLNCVCRNEASQLENKVDKRKALQKTTKVCFGDSGLWDGGVGFRLNVCFVVYPRKKDFLHFLAYVSASELGKRQGLLLLLQPH